MVWTHTFKGTIRHWSGGTGQAGADTLLNLRMDSWKSKKISGEEPWTCSWLCSIWFRIIAHKSFVNSGQWNEMKREEDGEDLGWIPGSTALGAEQEEVESERGGGSWRRTRMGLREASTWRTRDQERAALARGWIGRFTGQEGTRVGVWILKSAALPLSLKGQVGGGRLLSWATFGYLIIRPLNYLLLDS